jgi:hypothetical protein
MIIDLDWVTIPKLSCLAKAGVESIIKYYARKTKYPDKLLTRIEAEAIIAAGMTLGVVYQSAGDSAEAFSYDDGMADGAYARTYAATKIGQPGGSAIYFGVDYDSDEPDLTERIVPYFRGVRDSFCSTGNLPIYRIGVYGDGVTLQRLLDERLVEFTWISQSVGFPGSRQFKGSNRWTLFQNMPSTLCNCDVDIDELNPAIMDFGAFNRLNPISGSLFALRQSTVTARAGVRLRNGPGVEFDVSHIVPARRTLKIISRCGDWALVDLENDGLADGFIHSAFLSDE